ncbi:MAG: primosomal protein N' [candidate division WOR-3 bacterium]
MNSEIYANVIIPKSGLDYFTYRVPPGLIDKVRPGVLVVVPFQRTRSKGVVFEIINEAPIEKSKIKDIESILDDDFSTTENHLKLALWMSRYYISNLSEVIQLFFPPGLVERGKYIYKLKNVSTLPLDNPVVKYLLEKKPHKASLRQLQKVFGSGIRRILEELEREGIVVLENNVKIKKYRELNLYTPYPVNIPKEPTTQQKIVIEKFFSDQRLVSLLHGVTGSGKTRVYTWIIEKYLQQGKSAIVLVPEIALTPQIFNYFSQIFHQNVVFYHSRLGDTERRWVFRAVRKGERKILIGPRSALFLPIKDPGIIIIDEEHDSSYKEIEGTPSYHARDVAIKLAELQNIRVLLGSGSPSLESYYLAKKGEYLYLTLTERVPHYNVPKVQIIDMRKRKTQLLFSLELLDEIQKTVNQNKQIILFLNRRGYAPFLICIDCGNILKCHNCSVNLVYHKTESKLKCHTCGLTTDIPETCPNCGSTNIKFSGTGTQKVEEIVKKYFPNMEVKRFDLDAFIREGVDEGTFKEFLAGKLNLLVGTKMVGKGFDFPNLGLVGVINADVGLGLPDFRAEEKVFQLLLQIIGRIRKGGKVLIQTFNPDSRAVAYSAKMNYEEFAEAELKEREKFLYPPFVYLTIIEIAGPELEKITQVAKELKEKISVLSVRYLEIIGPVPSPISRKGGNFLVRLLLKYKDKNFPEELNFLKNYPLPKNVYLSVYVDPVDML